MSAAGSFWFFGPGERPGTLVVVLGDCAGATRGLSRIFAHVRPIMRAVPDSLRARIVPEQRNTWVFVCDGPRQTLQQLWPSLAGQN